MQTRASKFKGLLTHGSEVVAAGLSLIGLVIATAVYLVPAQGGIRYITDQTVAISDLQVDVLLMQRDIGAIKAQLASSSGLSDQSEISSKLSSLNTSVDSLQDRFSTIEKLILRDPPRALEIPLMRKDIDSVRDSTQTQIAAIKQDVDRNFTLVMGS